MGGTATLAERDLQDSYHRAEHLYLLPIGGTAMASLAGLLHARGHRVEGVDGKLYPPMSTLLEELGIAVRQGWDPNAIPADIDRVIIGNAVGRDNPEVRAILERRLPHLSQAEAVAHYILAEGRESLVVAGTHGKTTTTSILAWILETTGLDPTYLIGGLASWNRRSFRLGQGPHMVIEGDEYNTCFFDRGPKLFHYRPHVLLLGPVEFDHADIFPNLNAVLTAFRAATAQVPPHGTIVVEASCELSLAACRDATAPLVRVGQDRGDELRIRHTEPTINGTHSHLEYRGQTFDFEVPLAGSHNATNAAMACAAALTTGIPIDRVLGAVARFPGVARRMEVVGEAANIVVVDDFAHHPTALAATVAAARQRWCERRLVVAYEPRSLSAGCRSFQKATEDALADADLVLLAPVFHQDRLGVDKCMDRRQLQSALATRGVRVLLPQPSDDPVAVLLPELEPGDVMVGCSSGSFDDLHRRLLTALATGLPQTGHP